MTPDPVVATALVTDRPAPDGPPTGQRAVRPARGRTRPSTIIATARKACSTLSALFSGTKFAAPDMFATNRPKTNSTA
ncbi:hypothetical protein Cus16_2555 [Curtobacterium sp. ER1/6]|nr:hypothetical protein Cus16_2555 [Curtobacterium sp. ER1/6]